MASATIESYFLRLNGPESGVKYSGRAVWDESGGISLTLLDGKAAWDCLLTKTELIEIQEEKNLDKVYEWAKQVFQGQSESDGLEDHHFAIDTKSRKLSWKKAPRGSKVKLRLGEFDLKKVDFVDAQNSVFEAADAQKITLQKTVQDLKRAIEEKDAALEKMTLIAEEFEDEKTKVEQQCYEKFLPILQAKQEKNRELLLAGRPEASSARRSDDDDSNDYDQDTDEDDNMAETPSKKSKASEEPDPDDSQDFLNA